MFGHTERRVLGNTGYLQTQILRCGQIHMIETAATQSQQAHALSGQCLQGIGIGAVVDENAGAFARCSHGCGLR